MPIPNEWDLQQQQIERKRKFAEALRAQSGDMGPAGQMVGNWYVPTAPTNYLAKALQGALAAYQGNRLDQQEQDTAKKRQDAYSSTTQEFADAMRGHPQETMAPGVMGPPAPAVPGDPKAALAALLRNPDTAGPAMDAQLKQLLAGSKYGTTPQYDQQGRAFVLNDQGQPKFLEGIQARDKMTPVNLGGVTQFVNPYQAPTEPLQHVITPESLLADQRIRSEGAMNRGVTLRGQNLVDARSRLSAPGDETGFSPDAITNAAARYNIDGTLPPMGMGKAGVQVRTAILNKAAEMAKGVGLEPDQQRIQQIGNKANSAALSTLQRQQSMVGAFERNFNKNADIALQYSTKVDNTGVPIVNKWLNAGKRAIAGDPTLAAYDASIKATANEYAKIVSGSMGNTALAESEIKKIEGLLNAAQTPQQVNSVISLMKQETQNRMKGFDDEKAALRQSMGRAPLASPHVGGAAPSPARPMAFQIPGATSAPSVSNW